MNAPLRAFAAGFAATLLFHQAVIAVFHALGMVPNPPFSLTPTEPLGVPAVLSLAFWGGLWGVPIWLLIRGASGVRYWVRGIAAGAVGPSAVALFIVFPLKGMAFAAGWDPRIFVGALIVNAAWGLGVCLLMRWPRLC